MMGKSVAGNTSWLRNLAKSTVQKTNKTPKTPKPTTHNRPTIDQKPEKMGDDRRLRLPLAMVVSDCARRWFHDTLKEARAGKISMQVLLGQMYHSGYGIPRNREKGKVWLERASRTRPLIWEVGEKHPGYDESDSDSDVTKGDS